MPCTAPAPQKSQRTAWEIPGRQALPERANRPLLFANRFSHREDTTPGPGQPTSLWLCTAVTSWLHKSFLTSGNKDLAAQQMRDSLLLSSVTISLCRAFCCLLPRELGSCPSCGHRGGPGLWPLSPPGPAAATGAAHLVPCLSSRPPRRGGGEDKCELPSQRQTKGSAPRAFCGAVRGGQRLCFTAVPASNRRKTSISALNCIAKPLIN